MFLILIQNETHSRHDVILKYVLEDCIKTGSLFDRKLVPNASLYETARNFKTKNYVNMIQEQKIGSLT